jgi:predicted esterase
MHQHELTFSYKARYSRIGEITKDTRQVWIVLHGYGQLARFFIRKFSSLEEHRICVIAPEGLSRFYLEDVAKRSQTGNDRVGATWMTKENRLMDIENYIQYLNALYRHEVGPSLTTPVTILGFSQGAATASRWITEQALKFNRLILWAGILPPDMNFEVGKEVLKDKETYLVYGNTDPFLNDSRFGEMQMLASKLGITPQRIEFDGAHDIDEKTLLKFV